MCDQNGDLLVEFEGKVCVAHNLSERALKFLEEHPKQAPFFDGHGKIEITLPSGQRELVCLSKLRLVKEDK
mgnify:CR=1 FL=1